MLRAFAATACAICTLTCALLQKDAQVAAGFGLFAGVTFVLSFDKWKAYYDLRRVERLQLARQSNHPNFV
jgi:hypothetical protein